MSASSSLAGEMGDVPPDGPVDIDALEVLLVRMVFVKTYIDFYDFFKLFLAGMFITTQYSSTTFWSFSFFDQFVLVQSNCCCQ